MKKKVKKFLMILILVLALFQGLILFTNIYKLFLTPLVAGVEVNDDYGDVILVLGGGLRKGLKIGYSTEERLNLAVELFKKRERMIIVSDGSLYRGSPAKKKIIDYLVNKGVQREYIKLEGKSQTTYDSLIFTLKMIRDMKLEEIIVCTSPYHQERVKRILDYLQFKNFRIVNMNKSEIHHSHSIKQRLRNSWLILREYLAIFKFQILRK